MNVTVEPIKDLNKITEHLNEFRLIEAVKKSIERLDAIETRLSAIEQGKKSNAAMKAPKQVGSFTSYILRVVQNGKIWSTYAIAEEIRNHHPLLPAFKDLAIQNACSRLHKEGLLEKVAYGNYRKKS